ncbi:AraC family transcriptional regulator N-terminal domain-containing protein [Bradyrhizobium sp. BRP14]|nr:AraC family transcriptional regulator N-terminal domain-containing protein [Bradyrhizobium sp. BRP14]
MTTLQDIAEAIESRTGVDGSFSTSMPRVFLLRSSEPTAPIHTLYEPSVCFVAQGRKLVESGRYRMSYGAGAALAVASPLPVTGQVIEASRKAPFLGLRIELDLDLLRGFHAATPRETPGTYADKGLTTFQPSQRLEETILRLLRLLDNPEEMKVLGPVAELEILYHLATYTSPALKQLAAPETATARTAWAADYLRLHWRDRMALSTLAERLHMTERRLRANFVALTGHEPAAYQKRLRLQEARRLLALGAPLSSAAASTGFANGKSLEAEYEAAFHISPVLDAAWLRRLFPVELEE